MSITLNKDGSFGGGYIIQHTFPQSPFRVAMKGLYWRVGEISMGLGKRSKDGSVITDVHVRNHGERTEAYFILDTKAYFCAVCTIPISVGNRARECSASAALVFISRKPRPKCSENCG